MDVERNYFYVHAHVIQKKQEGYVNQSARINGGPC